MGGWQVIGTGRSELETQLAEGGDQCGLCDGFIEDSREECAFFIEYFGLLVAGSGDD